MKLKYIKGFTLIETIVAMFVISIFMIGISTGILAIKQIDKQRESNFNAQNEIEKIHELYKSSQNNNDNGLTISFYNNVSIYYFNEPYIGQSLDAKILYLDENFKALSFSESTAIAPSKTVYLIEMKQKKANRDYEIAIALRKGTEVLFSYSFGESGWK